MPSVRGLSPDNALRIRCPFVSPLSQPASITSGGVDTINKTTVDGVQLSENLVSFVVETHPLRIGLNDFRVCCDDPTAGFFKRRKNPRPDTGR